MWVTGVQTCALPICEGSELADLDGPTSGNAKFVLGATSGGGHRFGVTSEVCERS